MKIEEIKEKFDIDVGAPTPTILSNELNLYLIFYVSNVDPNWDGKSIHMRTDQDDGIITIKFDLFEQFKFGSPNDEAMSGHPLYELGLKPYSIQKVIDSEWIKQLKKINSVHPYHKDELFEKYKHFIFFFHDTCFEIVAESYSIEQNSELNLRDEIQRISKLL
ncbi:hypothetical protein BWZ20_00310 [Winogradskyella sp. J14-2]|uniref:hypothetical protein n=1 Tax=Winogradskyella sp. J14-2 TaxID=1936080 RepID=UPI000972B6E0|nr:hypothetical protein [Winogradskyella sp. J14-2]APY06830.1 hypothetical protein BWZ20_00310 [Winogradskyella sp. J14-2]